MNENIKEVYMYVLGALVVLGAFAIVALMIYHPVPAESKDTINIAIGLLIGNGVVVVNYFFGSSKSSADKNTLLAEKKESE